MNSTIAVALITAIATLSGVCLASVTSLVVQRRQVELQKTTATQEHNEQREREHRQIRRDAYVKFLTQVEQTMKVLNDFWLEPPPATRDEAALLKQKIYNYTSVVNETLITIYLEGPTNVEHKAGELASTFEAQTNLMYNCARQNIGKEGRLIDFTGSSRKSLESELWGKELEFIIEARNALGDVTDIQLH